MTKQSITSNQEAQLKNILFGAAKKAVKVVRPNKDGMQLLITRGGEFQDYLVEGIRRYTAKMPNYDTARMILGKDFISPEDIAKARGVVYTEEQLLHFGKTMTPSQEVLKWCRDNDYMIVAGPPRPMSLLEVRDLNQKYFYSETGGWYANDKEKFARNDKVEPWWIMLRKKPIDDSTDKNWTEQQKLLQPAEFVPNAAEVTWAVTTYKAVRGVYLLPNVYVRTSSVDSGGYRVSVGLFDSKGLNVSYCSDDVRNVNLGLSSARK
jgi:hypothetical protein